MAYFLSFPYISAVTLRHTLARGALVDLICFECDCQLYFQITVLIHTGLACSSSAADYDKLSSAQHRSLCWSDCHNRKMSCSMLCKLRLLTGGWLEEQDLQRASVPPSPRPSTVQPNFDAPPASAPGDQHFAGGPVTSADNSRWSFHEIIKSFVTVMISWGTTVTQASHGRT